MSLKRYALIAAASQHLQQYKNNTKITTSTIAPLQQTQEQQQNETKKTTIEILNKDNNITTTTTTATTNISLERPAFAPAIVQPHFILNPVASGSSSHVEGGSSSPSITSFYGGGLGVFHQQNIRANSVGSSFSATGSSLNGAGVIGIGGSGVGTGSNGSYSHTINGNVNLLLGGAMLSLITTVLCVVCYCCHRNIKKRTEAEYRQQSQWMENDPNMEIYSVEQCYETSAIFLGESTDGLPTVPTLSHEPPPSYDAVLAMQEQQRIQQQQQQLLQQQHSPPPGYRSTLDISNNTANNNNNNNNNNNFPLLVSSAAYSHAAHDANGNFNSCDNSEHLEPTGSNNQNNNMLHWKFCTLNSTSNSNSSSLSARSELIKKVLHAQSCCSLQRAEVESMWNAAAAAVAARQNQNVTNNMQDELLHESCDNMPRKSLPTCSNMLAHKRVCGSNNLTLCVLGQQANYRRGCPLCGKFRYAETLSLTVSTESGLNLDTASGYNTLNNNNNNCLSSSIDYSAECACANQTEAATAAAEDLKNGNTILYTETTHNMSEAAHSMATADKEDNNANITTTTATATFSSQVLEDGNTETSTAIEQPQLNLDTINVNGIVRVDMSKIIDKTGLPTYEAALKLESSGYV